MPFCCFHTLITWQSPVIKIKDGGGRGRKRKGGGEGKQKKKNIYFAYYGSVTLLNTLNTFVYS